MKTKKRIAWVLLGFLLTVLLATFITGFLYLVCLFGQDMKKIPGLVKVFFSSPDQYLSSSGSRINFLVLGVAGGNHNGSDLTDTMIFFSMDKHNGDTMMMSVPRDIWVSSLVSKINAVYHYGQEKGGNEGFVSLSQVFQELFDQSINYYILIDFQAFEELIDLVGGVEVMVERGFDDWQYPISGKENDECDGDDEYKCRYEHLHFDRGLNNMDGKTALKFVRSRNADGEEGTDFARSQRQQKVMLALKNRVFDWKILSSPEKIRSLFETVNKYIIVNPSLSAKEQVGMVKLLVNFLFKQKGFRILNLETGDEDNPGFLISPLLTKYDQWALEPVNADWTKLQNFIKEKIQGGY